MLEYNSPGDMPYEDWARKKYNEIQLSLSPTNQDGELDPIRLNSVLTKFSGFFAWAITIQEIESNKLNILQTEYDEWSKALYRKAEKKLIEDGGGLRRATVASIEAKASEMTDGGMEKRQKVIVDRRSRVDLLKGFVRVLDKTAGILQTLSSNMRSELFFAGGVPIGRNLTPEEVIKKSKSIVRKAMKGQEPDRY